MHSRRIDVCKGILVSVSICLYFSVEIVLEDRCHFWLVAPVLMVYIVTYACFLPPIYFEVNFAFNFGTSDILGELSVLFTCTSVS